jgi:hypothetical protein
MCKIGFYDSQICDDYWIVAVVGRRGDAAGKGGRGKEGEGAESFSEKELKTNGRED